MKFPINFLARFIPVVISRNDANWSCISLGFLVFGIDIVTLKHRKIVYVENNNPPWPTLISSGFFLYINNVTAMIVFKIR